METEGKDFSTPERRAGLERALADVVAAIGDGKIADYYRRDFEQKVFEAFKRRPATPKREWQPAQRWNNRRGEGPRAPLGSGETVSSAVKASQLARSGRTGARRMKETELAALLLAEPALGMHHAELLADLPFATPRLTGSATCS